MLKIKVNCLQSQGQPLNSRSYLSLMVRLVCVNFVKCVFFKTIFLIDQPMLCWYLILSHSPLLSSECDDLTGLIAGAK